MTHESYSQAELFEISYDHLEGQNALVVNKLTSWALEQGIYLASLPISKFGSAFKKPTFKRVIGKTPKIKIDRFVESPWTRWYVLNTKPITHYSISEYRHLFNRKLPEWAKSFKSRGISKEDIQNDRHKYKFINENDGYEMENWRIERELYKVDKKKSGEKVIVERVYSASGKCNKVTLIRIFPDTGGRCIVQVDVRKSVHQWESGRTKTWLGRKSNHLLRDKIPWGYKLANSVK